MAAAQSFSFVPTLAPVGTLTIKAPPGCEVFWEGVSLGEVPADGFLRVAAIPPGAYQVFVRRPGFVSEGRRISVDVGEQTLAFSLKPIPVLRDDSEAPPQHPIAPPPVATTPGLPVESTSAVPPTAAQPKVTLESAVEEKSSQIKESPPTPLFWSVLVICALLAALFRFLWSQRKLPKSSTLNAPRDPRADRHDSFGESATQSWPAPPAFLEDLRRREEMSERGMASGSPKPSGKTIDLDGDDVRAVEE